MGLSKANAQRVTDHVIVRWLERIEGYNLDEAREYFIKKNKEPTDVRILDYLADKYGLFRGHIAYRILNKDVRAAVRAGVRSVNKGNWRLVISPEGRIVTIEPRMNSFIRAERSKRVRMQRSA